MKVQYKIMVEVELDDSTAESGSSGTLQKAFSNEMEKTLNVINSDVMTRWYVKSVESKLNIYDQNDECFALKQLKYSKEN